MNKLFFLLLPFIAYFNLLARPEESEFNFRKIYSEQINTSKTIELYIKEPNSNKINFTPKGRAWLYISNTIVLYILCTLYE